LVVIAIVGVIFIKFIIATRTPVKYAIQLEDVYKYPDAILVQQTWHTGTGWERIGDAHGLYEKGPNKILDVELEGNLPPRVGMGGDHVNIFLCEVTPTGTYRIPGTVSPVHLYEKFEVTDWYPIYPVKRYTVFLPSWFYPNNYLSENDMK
jgi:hypothetical protein